MCFHRNICKISKCSNDLYSLYHYKTLPLAPRTDAPSQKIWIFVLLLPAASLAWWLRCPPRERKIPGSNPACVGIFSGLSHTSDLNRIHFSFILLAETTNQGMRGGNQSTRRIWIFVLLLPAASLAWWLRCPPRKRKVPGSNPACVGIFSGLSHTSDLKIGTPVATPARHLAL